MVKLMFILAILGFGTWSTYLVLPVYSTYWKVQDAFEAMAHNMADKSVDAISVRMPEVFKIKYIASDDVPQEFYDNLVIKADGNRVELYSSYTVTVWLFGEVEGVDPDSEYDSGDIKGMDLLREKGRLDFAFEPYAETP
jgi:hypothetical protein